MFGRVVAITLLLSSCQVASAHPGRHDGFGCHTESKSGKRHCRSASNYSISFTNAEWVKNYDGDTITVNLPNVHHFFGKEVDVRVKGIDTPEIRSKNKCEKSKALKAKEVVETLCSKAKTIALNDVEKGKYFRIVADVVCDGKSVAKELTRRGLAVSYHGGKKVKTFYSCLD